MARVPLTFDRAGELLEVHRDAILDGRNGGALRRVSRAGRHVDAALTADGNVLIITGSNSWQDYLFYNLRPFRPVPRMPEIDRLTTDIPLTHYHKGFLLHAARILKFLGDDRPDQIVGHSLGAAAAQILGTALAVPTICFASPQVVKRRILTEDRFRAADHPQWNVFNVAWDQDFVTRGYRLTGLRALGRRVSLDLGSWNIGIDHFVADYRRLLALDRASGHPLLPEAWPDPTFEPPRMVA